MFGSNLVVNGGFETGNFTGWTTILANPGSDFGVTTSFPHSGSYAADFGAMSGENDYIYQNLPTTPGTTYDISFWLDASHGVTTTGQFVANWGGNNLLTVTGGIGGGYIEYTYAETATSTSTDLQFGGNTVNNWYYLDDVSVVPAASSVPEPASLALLGAGLLGGLGAIRRKLAK
jgi:hypothetical protein